MNELTMEREFEIFKLLHKMTILEAKMTVHYKDLQSTGVTIPEFMQQSPQKLANREVQQLLLTDRAKFENLYQFAWDEVKELLP